MSTPVPPGQGELGRITVEWEDNSTYEDGFRIFELCDGEQRMLAETAANTTSLGPLQACRPGNVGVAAFAGDQESPIAWAEPEP